jgi:hypothetical protein
MFVLFKESSDKLNKLAWIFCIIYLSSLVQWGISGNKIASSSLYALSQGWEIAADTSCAISPPWEVAVDTSCAMSRLWEIAARISCAISH